MKIQKHLKIFRLTGVFYCKYMGCETNGPYTNIISLLILVVPDVALHIYSHNLLPASIHTSKQGNDSCLRTIF